MPPSPPSPEGHLGTVVVFPQLGETPYFILSQDPDGDWHYVVDQDGSKFTMTNGIVKVIMEGAALCDFLMEYHRTGK